MENSCHRLLLSVWNSTRFSSRVFTGMEAHKKKRMLAEKEGEVWPAQWCHYQTRDALFKWLHEECLYKAVD